MLKGSELRPVLLAVEDLHWIDESSEHVLKDLLEQIAGARVLRLFTYRPEYVHTWGGRSNHGQVNLNRLSTRETLAMVSQILNTPSVAEDLQNLILEKTEGVPFFIEELVKSLKDLRIIRKQETGYALSKDPKDVAIPSTIQDIILARVDAPPEKAKEVLQTGSVIEREFPHELIQKVTNLPEKELLSHLSALKDAELLYERGVYPESVYVFKHALTREVVYDSILQKKRKQLHEAIGTAIEELHKDDLAANFEVLTEHFFQGENYPKASECARRASRKAEKGGSLHDAVTHARRRVLCLERSPKRTGMGRQIVDARTVLGLYLTQMHYLKEAREAMAPAARLAKEMGYGRRLGQIQAAMGFCSSMVEHNFSAAFEALEEALRIGAEEEDVATLTFAS